MTEIAIQVLKGGAKRMSLFALGFLVVAKWLILVLNVGITIGKGLTKIGKAFVWGTRPPSDPPY
jgi:hypothetical protein